MIQIKEEMLHSWQQQLDELTETLNNTMKHIEDKKTDAINPIRYAELIGKESMLRSILSQISLSAADDIKNQ